MPPSLRVSVGVPPAVLTVTASLMVSVSVTTWPALRSPLPLVIPVPDANNGRHYGCLRLRIFEQNWNGTNGDQPHRRLARLDPGR